LIDDIYPNPVPLTPVVYSIEFGMERTAVIALGGNALMRKGTKFASFEEQRKVVEETAAQIAVLMDQGWRLAITHGNGPQVGDLLLMSNVAHEAQKEIPQMPLDAANANTQGSLGYLIAQAIRNATSLTDLT
jgi:carbamate kinase